VYRGQGSVGCEKFCVRVEEVIWGARREKKRKKKREKG
jgi:hypothetical protein